MERDEHAPLIEITPVADIYSDGIGDVDDLGSNFRVYYFTWTVTAPGIIERRIVCKMVRPKSSISRTEYGPVARLLAAKAAGGPRLNS
jgi:hypothetical protein